MLKSPGHPIDGTDLSLDPSGPGGSGWGKFIPRLKAGEFFADLSTCYPGM
jgi:hypothetical protein